MTTIIAGRLGELDDLVLAIGEHKSWGDGACTMEAVAYIAGEPWSDNPNCASPVLAAFVRGWNDAMNDDDRQSLKPYIPRLVGSKGTSAQETSRAWITLDWFVREHTPVWLRAAGLTDQAERLAGLPAIQADNHIVSFKSIIDTVRLDARAKAAGVKVATRAAATQAAEEAAWDIAWEAAWKAVRDAAKEAASEATWEAWETGKPIATQASCEVVCETALEAAKVIAALAVCEAARDAAWAEAGASAVWGSTAWIPATQAAEEAAETAATKALHSTVIELQSSAHTLVDRMLHVTEDGVT